MIRKTDALRKEGVFVGTPKKQSPAVIIKRRGIVRLFRAVRKTVRFCICQFSMLPDQLRIAAKNWSADIL